MTNKVMFVSQSNKDMPNLIEGIQAEVARNKELQKQYEEIGPSGVFGATVIKMKIADAEKAVAHGDTVGMVRMYQELKETE